jgi:PAS domain S-box-containing protein
MSHEKDFYKGIIDNLHDGVYFVDRDRVITYWNKGAERITGYTPAQTIGCRCRENLLNHVTANGVQLCLNHCPLAAVMEDGQPREAEVYLHHTDGHRMAEARTSTGMRDENGDIVGAVETFSSNASVINARRRISEMDQIVRADGLMYLSKQAGGNRATIG